MRPIIADVVDYDDSSVDQTMDNLVAVDFLEGFKAGMG